jgi:Tfp pilus assembly protein PilF
MDVETLYNKGFEFRCSGQYGEAQELFKRVLASEPAHKGSLHQMALIAGFMGDFDGSLASFAQLCEKYPADNDIRYDLAMTQMMLGDYDAGCLNLRKILSVDPTHEKASMQAVYCP